LGIGDGGWRIGDGGGAEPGTYAGLVRCECAELVGRDLCAIEKELVVAEPHNVHLGLHNTTGSRGHAAGVPLAKTVAWRSTVEREPTFWWGRRRSRAAAAAHRRSTGRPDHTVPSEHSGGVVLPSTRGAYRPIGIREQPGGEGGVGAPWGDGALGVDVRDTPAVVGVRGQRRACQPGQVMCVCV
jgi:hypothetical protein